jgi:release factor glutamine methyltransferase
MSLPPIFDADGRRAHPSVADAERFDALLARMTAAWHGLPDKPDEDPERTLRALWAFAAGNPRTIAQLDAALPALSEMTFTHLEQLIEDRLAGVPLSYLIGRQSFMGLEFLAGPQAMIPRRETEILAHGALKLLRMLAETRDHVRVLDLCTGSGNVALSLAYNVPACDVIGADISAEAVSLAQRNAVHLGLAGRAAFLQSDLFTAFEAEEFWGTFDMVTCNPPYISSARVNLLPGEIAGFEPRLAFDGGPLGIGVINRALREAPRFLKPGSWFGMEVGLGQGKAVLRALSGAGKYTHVHAESDAQGAERAVFGQV